MSAIKEYGDAKEEGDLIEEEFVQHCEDYGWTLLDLTGRFRNNDGAPIARNKTKKIKTPDYMLGKPPLATPIVVEVKGKDPVKLDSGDEYWLDDIRWEYFNQIHHEFSVGGLMVWKHKPYEVNDIDKFFCASAEYLAKNIHSYHLGGRDRNGKRSHVYTWKTEIFIPLKEFLTSDIMSGGRYPFFIKKAQKWVEI